MSYREGALRRAGHRCERCGSIGPLEVHHKHPRRQGGSDEPENLEVVCVPCHPRGGPREKTYPNAFNIRLTDRDLERLQRLADRLEISEAGVFRQALRELAKREKVE